LNQYPYIGQAVVSILVLAGAMLAAIRIPLAAAVFKLLFLVMWGLMTFGAFLYVVFAMHLPAGHYIQAAATLLLWAAVSLPWLFIGYPQILITIKQIRRGFTI